MSRIQLMRHAIELWYIPNVPKELCHANARKWVAAVERLGSKWLLHEKVKRIEEQK